MPRFPAHGQEAVAALENLLDIKESDTRWWVIRALAVFKETDVSGLLQRGLKDKDPSVAQCAALSLRENPSPEAIPDLIALLGHQDRLLARLAAAQVEMGLMRRSKATIDTIGKHFPSVDMDAWLEKNPYRVKALVKRWKEDLALAAAIDEKSKTPEMQQS